MNNCTNVLALNTFSHYITLNTMVVFSVICSCLCVYLNVKLHTLVLWYNLSSIQFMKMSTLGLSVKPVGPTFPLTRLDDLHISHNASGMEANIRVLLIRNSSSHSSLNVNGLELPCLAATLCFTRLHNQDNSLMRSWYQNKLIKNRELTASSAIENSTYFLTFTARGHRSKYFLKVCS